MIMSFMEQEDTQCPGCKEDPSYKRGDSKHYVCDRLLGEIAGRLPADWEKIGIYLGLNQTILDHIRGEWRNNVEAWALGMLDTWWGGTKPDTRWGELKSALAEIHRQDLIQFTKEYFHRFQIDPNNPDPAKMKKYFMRIAEQIPRDWRDLGIYLYIPMETMDSIQMRSADPEKRNRTFEVLKAWKAKTNYEFDELMDVLQTIGRLDIRLFAEKRIKEYKLMCRHTDPQEKNTIRCELGPQRPQTAPADRMHFLQFQPQSYPERPSVPHHSQPHQHVRVPTQPVQMQTPVQPAFVTRPVNAIYTRPPGPHYVPPDQQQPQPQPSSSYAPNTAFSALPASSIAQQVSVSAQQPTSESSHVLHMMSQDPSLIEDPSRNLSSTQLLSINSGASNPSLERPSDNDDLCQHSGTSSVEQGMRDMNIADQDSGDGGPFIMNTMSQDMNISANDPTSFSTLSVSF